MLSFNFNSKHTLNNASKNFKNINKAIINESFYTVNGKVLENTSLIIRAFLPNVTIGDLCTVSIANKEPLMAQVVGFKDGEVFLMPLGDLNGLSPNSTVTATNKPFTLKVGYELLGRVLDGTGKPIDGLLDLNQIPSLIDWPLYRTSPHPMKRGCITEKLSLGIRAIDGLLTVGKGQRIGLFAGSGVGKSSLMGQIVRNTESKIVVVCLLGERGREVKEFIEYSLKEDGLKKCVMVVATSDTPSLVRYISAHVATAIAEWFRDMGEDVLFLMDSATRFARSQREIGLSLGEPPARQGFPPSVFLEIPKLMERTGKSEKGSITAIYTVLVSGGDFDEPISDEVRGILDGHIILSRDLFKEGLFPSIDVLSSVSRVMPQITTKEHQKIANEIKKFMAIYEKNKDLLLLGAYKIGTDALLDQAIKLWPKIFNFLNQPINEKSDYKQTYENLSSIILASS